MASADNDSSAHSMKVGGPYAWYVLGLLVLVCVFNFVDRQILAILAEDIKRDLGIGDAEIGFLYGTVFGVFYALFGIPLGRLADMVSRVRLLTVGVTLWSAMTALSGFAQTFGSLTAARIGVGVGEASASPVAYSMLSDLFHKKMRATVLAIYLSGVYIGSGLSLFMGGAIKDNWNDTFPEGGPFGLVGWQAAFLAVGVPGLLVALWVSTLREPIRGGADGIITPQEPRPWKKFIAELSSVIPPFTFVHAAGFGGSALLANVLFAVFAAALAFGLSGTLGNWPQWTALGIGAYATFSWAQSIKQRDLPTYQLIWGTPTFIFNMIGFGSLSLVTYATLFWSTPYAIRHFGIDAATAGLYIGSGAALGGFIGIIVGGRLADHLRLKNPAGRIYVGFISILGSAPTVALQFTTDSLTLYYGLVFLNSIFASMWVSVAIATTQDLVMPRMRGASGATQLLASTMIGLGIGPYAVGKISEVTGNLGLANLCILGVFVVSFAALLLVVRGLPAAEASRVERARAAGEVVAT